MSLADYLGQIIGLSLVGVAFLAASVAWIALYLKPKSQELARKREAHELSIKESQLAIDFDRGCRELVNDLITFENQIPEEVMKQAWALDELSSNQGRKRLGR